MSPQDGMSLNEPRDKIIQDFWIILESRDQPLPGSFPAAIKNVEKTNTIAISHWAKSNFGTTRGGKSYHTSNWRLSGVDPNNIW